jgi:hypothetical protein
MQILKKHILSDFAVKSGSDFNETTFDMHLAKKTNAYKSGALDTTRITRAIEPSDPDEFLAYGKTNKTYTIEISDPDEFVACVKRI